MYDIKLVSIELYLFDGMRLGGIKRFKLTPKNDKVVILGTNGAGKSRFMRTILPHSVAPNDLYDGGHIIHHYRIDGDDYTFKQRKVGKSLKCYIVKGDMTIVDGSNPTVYNNEVEKLFGFDKKTKELITGRIKFTDMSSTDRKYWFSKLANSDLSVALKYFKVLKEHQRDNNGAIKVTERYVADALPMVLKDKEELESLTKRLEALEVEHDNVNQVWLEHRSKVSNLNSMDLEFKTITDTIMGIDTEGLLPALSYTSEIARLESEVEHTSKYIIPRINKEITDLDSKLKEKEYYSKNLESFVNKCRKRKEELEVIEKTDNLFFPRLVNLPANALEVITSDATMASYFVTAINGLVSDKKLSDLESEYDVVVKKISDITQENFVDNNIIRNMEEYISKHNHTNDVECPSCRYSFKPGLIKPKDEAEYNINLAKTRIDNRASELSKLILVKDELIYDIKTKKELGSVLVDYSGRLEYSELITTIKNNVGFTRGLNFTMWHDKYVEGARLALDYLVGSEELKKLDEERVVAMSISGVNYSELTDKYNALSDELLSEKNKLDTLTNKLSKLRNLYEKAKLCDDLEKRLEILLEGYDSAIINQASVDYAKLLGDKKMELWDLISTLKDRKVRLDKDKAELEYNQATLANLKEKKLVYDETVKNLSPSDGILAEYIYRGIHAITDSMNLFIEQVFNYPLIVKPCDVEDGELDYTFPFVEGDMETDRPDVSAGSDAQLEIFNSTFMLSAVKSLGLVGQPLMLDEPSRYMNLGHKTNYADFVAGLHDTQVCSQLFVVSHLKEFHSRLGRVDYVVIMDDGIDVPEHYNDCVEIEYD